MGISGMPDGGSMGISGMSDGGSTDQNGRSCRQEQTVGCAALRCAASLALSPNLSWYHFGDPLAVSQTETFELTE